MPLFHDSHHQRRHSWPYCGAERQSRLHWSDSRISKPRPGARQKLLFFRTPTTRPPFAADPYHEEEEDDDAAFAGIVRSKSARSHRLWSTLSRHRADMIVSSVTEANEMPSSVLRRMIRPPLDRARSLFVSPTAATTKDHVVVSCWVDSSPPAVPEIVSDGDVSPLDDGPRLSVYIPRPPHNHRRRHSEQPRAWREPSASLFTLEEE